MIPRTRARHDREKSKRPGNQSRTAAPRRTGQVVDIFATLKKSLETAERPQRKATADQPKRKRKA